MATPISAQPSGVSTATPITPIPFTGFSPASGVGARGYHIPPLPGFQGSRPGYPSDAWGARSVSPLPPRPASGSQLKTPAPFSTGSGGTPAPLRASTPPTSATQNKTNRKRPPSSGSTQPSSSPSPATTLPPVKVAEAAGAPKRKKRRPPEKAIPERVAALIPESVVYNQSREVEKRVDATLTRKKTEIQEALKSPARDRRTLRLYISNTWANQGGTGAQGAGAKAGEAPSWTLRIWGRLLEEGGEGKVDVSQPPLSTMFKKVVIELDPTLSPAKPNAVWEAEKAAGAVDGFEVKRQGSTEFVAKITVHFDYQPERFQLSARLASLIGCQVETRARIVSGLWHYIKAKKLQDASDPTMVNCDLPLREVLGETRVKLSGMLGKLQPHLGPPGPVKLEHRMKLSGPEIAAAACYDIQVDVPSPLQAEMRAFLDSTNHQRGIDGLDAKIQSDLCRLNAHRIRRAFFLGFSHSPALFIDHLMASQQRDLRQALGGAGGAVQEVHKERKSEFYKQPWVEDAVLRYLNRKSGGGSEGLT